MSCAAHALRALVVVLALSVVEAVAQEGTIDGHVTLADGRALPSVMVEVVGLSAKQQTNEEGRYRVTLPAGTYTIALRLSSFERIERGVAVLSGESVALNSTVDWPVFFVEALTVVASARVPEAIVDTSSSAEVLGDVDLRTEVPHGQLPRVLAFTPGAELTQSGLFDFNLNARGFNTAVNRHVKTMIDGRDPSVPVLLGYQDWAANSMPLDEVERVEFIRGPGAALYGAGAFNGVLNIKTRSPRHSPGGYGRFTFGGLDTRRVELRHAGPIGSKTAFKLAGGYHYSRDFTQPRVDGTEYGGGTLPLEEIPPPKDHLEIGFGSLRIDTDFGPDRLFVAEGGISTLSGVTTVTSVGRTQATDNLRPWGRVAFEARHWTATAQYSGQQTDGQVGLSTGAPLYFDAYNAEVELVGNLGTADGRGWIIGGASAGWQGLDSADPQGQQTVFSSRQHLDRQAVFGQVDYQLVDGLRGLFAGRVDWHDLHSVEFSPRGAVVYSLSPDHSVRFSASRAFQAPSATEYFLSTPVAPPFDLSPIETALAPLLNGQSLGFENVPLLAVGNPHLQVEQISGFETGYSGIIARRAYATVTYYRSWLSDFTSNLLPQAGTPLGRLNPDYEPYAPPPGLSPQAAAAVTGALDAALPPALRMLMSNTSTGAPVFIALSNTNVGKARTQGLESSVRATIAAGWSAGASYTLFDYEIDSADSNLISPNAPTHRWSAAVSYDATSFSASFRYRWVDRFFWSSGIFAGDVPSYSVADIQGLYALTRSLQISIDVANVFDDEHYEIYGGDVLRRRVLASLRYSW